MARVTFRPELIAYLLSKKGEIVFLASMLESLPVGVSPASVRAAMRKFVEEGEPLKITVLAAGNAWRVGSMQSAGRVDAPAPTVEDWGRVKDQKAAYERRGVAAEIIGPLLKPGRMEDGSDLVKHEGTGQLYTLKRL